MTKLERRLKAALERLTHHSIVALDFLTPKQIEGGDFDGFEKAVDRAVRLLEEIDPGDGRPRLRRVK